MTVKDLARLISEKAFQHSGSKQQWTQYKGEYLFP